MQCKFGSLWKCGLGIGLLELCLTCHAVTTVWVPDLEVRPGTLVSVPIFLDTSDSLYGFQVDVRYDAEQLIGSLAVRAEAVGDGVVVKSSLIDSGHQRLVIFSNGEQPLANQQLAILGLVVPSDISEEPLEIQLEGLALAGVGESVLEGSAKGGVLTVVIVPEEIEVSGSVTYIGDGGAMPGVVIRVEGEEVIEGPSDALGLFGLSVPSEVPLALSASRSSDVPPNRGVTSLDLLLLRRHILGVTPFESPWMRIAGDVDRDGEIGAIDLLLMRRLILGISDRYQAGQALFRFYPASVAFPQPEEPWDVLQEYRYLSLSADQPAQNFQGVKLGDVDGDWETEQASFSRALVQAGRSTNSVIDSRLERPMGLELRELPSEPGFSSFAVGCSDCEGLTSIQFSLAWDPQSLGLESVRPGEGLALDAEGFGYTPARGDQGVASFLWYSEGFHGIGSSDERSLFVVRFRFLSDERTAPAFSNDPTPAFASRGLASVSVVTDPPLWGATPPAALGINSFDDAGKGGMVVIEVKSERGRQYALEFTESLPLGSWQLLSVAEGNGGVIEFHDAIGAETTRFYRVRWARGVLSLPYQEKK